MSRGGNDRRKSLLPGALRVHYGLYSFAIGDYSGFIEGLSISPGSINRTNCFAFNRFLLHVDIIEIVYYVYRVCIVDETRDMRYNTSSLL